MKSLHLLFTKMVLQAWCYTKEQNQGASKTTQRENTQNVLKDNIILLQDKSQCEEIIEKWQEKY